MNLPVRRLPVLFLALCLVGTFPCGALPSAAQTPPAMPTEEAYRYDISFLWFDRIAEAELSLQPEAEGHRWRALLEARTLGVAAWLTSDRVQQYASDMELGGDGRFTALRHDSNITKNKGGRPRVRLKSYLFDYERRCIVRRVNRNGQQKDDVILAMPAVQPNDILTAFYNFRRGAYGPVEAGRRYRIPTYTGKGPGEILVTALASNARPASPRFPADGLLLKVELDKEVFDTSEGVVYVWLDEQRRPAQVVVENVIGLGDVRCVLQQEGSPS